MIEYHNGKLAINVKDHHLYAQDDRFSEYSQQVLTMAYGDCQEAFWSRFAPYSAEKFGYGKVFAEGRSGGWLIVENEPSGDELEFTPKEFRELIDKWEDFQAEILAAMDYCCNERLFEILIEMSESAV
jgi:hypothetical protein